MKRLEIKTALHELLTATWVKGTAIEGSFLRNSRYVFSGKLLIILVTFLTAPILTRIYTPTQYGFFSQFSLYVSNFSMLAAAGYPLALTISHNQIEFNSLFILSVSLTVISLFIASLISLTVIEYLVPAGFPIPGLFIFLLCTGALIFSLMYIIPRWNIYRSQFKEGAVINSSVLISSRLVSIFLGLFSGWQFIGLIVGEISGKFIGLCLSIWRKQFPSFEWLRNEFKFKLLYNSAKKFKEYPTYVLPSNYLSAISNQIPLFFLSIYFEPRFLGFYALALGVINLPCQLIANSIGPVFIRKAIYLKENEPMVLSIFTVRMISVLFKLSVIPFLMLMFFSSVIFGLAFGPEWKESGTYASLLCTIGVMELINSSTGSLYQIFHRERYLLKFSGFQFILTIACCIPGMVIRDPVILVFGFVTAKAFTSLLFFRQTLQLLKVKPEQLRILQSLMCGTIAILWLVSKILLN